MVLARLTCVEQPAGTIEATEPSDLSTPTPPPRRRLSDPPPDLADADRERLAIAQQQAENIEELTAATFLQGVCSKSFGDVFEPAAYQSFRDKFVRDAGDPTDPVEQMLLEQLMLAHHHIGRLHQKAAEARTPEAAKVFYGALTRLQGEFRRLALALRLYRSPVKSKQFTVVRQQNIAGGDQQVAQIDHAITSQSNRIPECRGDTQLVGKRSQKLETLNGAIRHEAKPKACRRRPAQSR